MPRGTCVHLSSHSLGLPLHSSTTRGIGVLYSLVCLLGNMLASSASDGPPMGDINEEAPKEAENQKATEENQEEAPKSAVGTCTMNIDYMSGEPMVQLAVPVDVSTRHLKQRIINKMKLDPFMDVYLLHDAGVLQHNDTLASAGFAAGESCQLMGILQEHWILNEAKKGKGVVLHGSGKVENTTVSDTWHPPPSSCRVILGKQPFPQGKHYFRVRLLTRSHYYIGVAAEDVNLNTWLGADIGRGWSYYLRDDRSGSRLGPGYINFGNPMFEGESVSFCFDTEAGTLQIAHNDGPLKPATSGLEGKDLYLALGMGPECSLQLEDAYSDCG